jgi:hypothetical protein
MSHHVVSNLYNQDISLSMQMDQSLHSATDRSLRRVILSSTTYSDDFCQFSVVGGTTGGTFAWSTAGRLWLEYVVDLYEIESPVTKDDFNFHEATAGVDDTHFLGTVGSLVSSDGFSVDYTQQRVRFPPGRFVVFADLVGTGLSDVAPTITSDGATTVVAAPDGVYHNSAGTLGSCLLTVNATCEGSWFSLDFNPSCTTLTSCRLICDRFNVALL